MTTFPDDDAYDALVVVREIPFHSLRVHRAPAFRGVAHVARLPGGRIAGRGRMSPRGVRKAATRTTTSALLGLPRDDSRTHRKLLSLVTS